eukprot:TRINITY_DN479_c0_g1_i1.p1 TRINITY_DN479_c0_g1~~TRINITY_DN479_c0_g1_i1.p1  ORF type:complete len:258 (+),score=112.99 TRINITY_DN479_c0_g1_i1:756-1529(+)
MSACAKAIRNVTLELGGKSAIMVFDDVDVELAVEWVMFGIFWTNGQICSATSRLLVHESIAERFTSRLVEEAKKIYIGAPCENLGRKGMLGPIVSAPQYQRVRAHIQGALDQGAELLCGGVERPAHLSKGYFVAPTILRVNSSMNIWRDEVFGPVLCVTTFSNEAEALRMAHDSDYGLAAAVMTNDAARQKRLGKALRVGVVWIQCSQPAFVEAPWGGLKKSGIGRELGPNGIDNYLEVKQVTHWLPNEKWGWYFQE